jgi:hypothetical protein
MLLAQHVLEECIDMHCTHPSLGLLVYRQKNEIGDGKYEKRMRGLPSGYPNVGGGVALDLQIV